MCAGRERRVERRISRSSKEVDEIFEDFNYQVLITNKPLKELPNTQNQIVKMDTFLKVLARDRIDDAEYLLKNHYFENSSKPFLQNLKEWKSKNYSRTKENIMYTYSFVDYVFYNGVGPFCCSYKDLKKAIKWCLTHELESLHYDKHEIAKTHPSCVMYETNDYFDMLNMYQCILTLKRTCLTLPIEIIDMIIDFMIDDNYMRSVFT